VRVQVRVVAVALAACACGSQVAPVLSLGLRARPAAIDDLGQRSVLTVSLFDTESGLPADGRVTVTAAAGLLEQPGRDAGLVQEVDLDDAGTALLGYTCRKALDTGCHGAVRLDAKWLKGSDWLETVARVTVGDGGL
jgi:hypothetical protein